jgi:site-specific DNA-cytosine methylase
MPSPTSQLQVLLCGALGLCIKRSSPSVKFGSLDISTTMRVISLFDGISCAQVALARLNHTNLDYYASEVEPWAIQIAKTNFPDTKHLGDVKSIKGSLLCPPGQQVDLLIGGSPCTDLSCAKNDRQGLDGERSKLFWEFVRILNEVKPKYFVLENVASMLHEDKKRISEALGVEPIMIDATLVSAQMRKRLFWTNIPVPKDAQPADRGLLLKDILEPEHDGLQRFTTRMRGPRITSAHKTGEQKARCLLSGAYRGPMSNGMTNVKYKDTLRKLSPLECERLQSLPDNYTKVAQDGREVPIKHRYKTVGNAFNVEVVKWILGFMVL